jgi:hypothetical protein
MAVASNKPAPGAALRRPSADSVPPKAAGGPETIVLETAMAEWGKEQELAKNRDAIIALYYFLTMLPTS